MSIQKGPAQVVLFVQIQEVSLLVHRVVPVAAVGDLGQSVAAGTREIFIIIETTIIVTSIHYSCRCRVWKPVRQ